jgi:hypothetical protein
MRLDFILAGRDQLSRVLDGAGDAATRLERRLQAAATGGSRAIDGMARGADGRLRDLRGRFVRETGAIAQASEALGGSLRLLAPAAIPAAASLAPIAVGAAAAGAATVAYTAALGPQITALGEAADAEQAYRDAVEESGARSAAAVKAHAALVRQTEKLPPATRETAAALRVFKDEYKAWSDSVATDTMAPITKGFGVLGAILPKVTPMARSFGIELDRTVTIAGGAVNTPGFDRLMTKVNIFAERTLTRANDRLVSFLNRAEQGEVGGAFQRFLDYARQHGPAVEDTLKNVGAALVNLLEAGSSVGVGLLSAINVVSSLVAAVPPGAIALFLQLAIAIKAVRLAAIGLGAARAAVLGFTASTVAMQAAAAGTTGRMAALGASFMAMSRSARLAVAGTGIGLLLITLNELMSIGQQAPADMDAMTSSIAQLGKTGKVSGEAARVLGADLGELETSVRTLARPSNYEGAIQWLGDLVDMDSAPVKVAKEQIGALDGALAQLVRNGNSELAEAAIRRLGGSLGNLTEGNLRDQLGQYQQALRDVAFEAQLTAESQGVFGQQALAVKSQLDAQKASADGLRQAIVALNDVNRAALGGMIGFEAAIDAAAEAASKNAGALSMSGGQLNLNSEKARTAASALTDLAAKTDEATSAARESGASWETVNGVYARGREALISSAQAMGLTKAQAAALADQILKTPDKTARLRGNMEDLQAKLDSAKSQLKRVPDSRRAAILAQIADLEAKVSRARSQLAGLDGTTATTYIRVKTIGDSDANGVPDLIQRRAQGGIVRRSVGGPVRGPGTSTSDSILTALSDGEYVVRARSVARYGLGFLDALNEGRLHQLVGADSASRSAIAAMPRGGTARPGRPAGPAGGAAAPVVIHLTVTGALDKVGVAKEIEQTLMSLRRARGGRPLEFV